jgi:hypothetical protein
MVACSFSNFSPEKFAPACTSSNFSIEKFAPILQCATRAPFETLPQSGTLMFEYLPFIPGIAVSSWNRDQYLH